MWGELDNQLIHGLQVLEEHLSTNYFAYMWANFFSIQLKCAQITIIEVDLDKDSEIMMLGTTWGCWPFPQDYLALWEIFTF
jgi:hypothetical protein